MGSGTQSKGRRRTAGDLWKLAHNRTSESADRCCFSAPWRLCFNSAKVSRFFYLRVLGRLVFSFISFAPRCISCFRIAGQTLERVDVTCVCFHLLHTGRANDALSHCYVIVALFSWFGSFSFCSTLFTLGHTSLRMLPPICWVN